MFYPPVMQPYVDLAIAIAITVAFVCFLRDFFKDKPDWWDDDGQT